MAKITIKPLSKNDLIFTKSFMTFSKLKTKGEIMKLIIQKIRDFLLRKKRKGRQLIFFEKIGDKNTSRDEMLKNLITVLEKNGFKIKNKK